VAVPAEGRGDVPRGPRHDPALGPVQNAAQRNGYRRDKPSADATGPEAADQRAEHLATGTFLAGLSETIFAGAWGDGRDFPTLKKIMDVANRADDLGRSATFATVAQQTYGGKKGSRRPVLRVREQAHAEARELSARCDAIRDSLTHRDRKVRYTRDD